MARRIREHVWGVQGAHRGACGEKDKKECDGKAGLAEHRAQVEQGLVEAVIPGAGTEPCRAGRQGLCQTSGPICLPFATRSRENTKPNTPPTGGTRQVRSPGGREVGQQAATTFISLGNETAQLFSRSQTIVMGAGASYCYNCKTILVVSSTACWIFEWKKETLSN